MRDLDRWKDKVELQLDGRQIFFLFFGSAMCACLIFVLGVVVGKRVEARAAAQARAPAEDPLAALDELGNAEEGFTFHSALSDHREGRKGKSPRDKDEARPPVRPEGADAKDQAHDGVAVVEQEGDDQPEQAQKAERTGKTDKADKADKTDKAPAPAALAARAPAADHPAPKARQQETRQPAKDAKDTRDAKDAKDAKADAARPKGHFTLQLSAFATKAEASDFMRRLRDAGYKPFLIESMVPGKGLMYRVRLGDYATHDAALSAKGEFERKQKIVAYVAKL